MNHINNNLTFLKMPYLKPGRKTQAFYLKTNVSENFGFNRSFLINDPGLVGI